MKASFNRRYYRKRNSGSDNHLFKQDQTKETTFFSEPSKGGFFKPASTLQRKEEPKKEEEKEVKRKANSANKAGTEEVESYVNSLEGSGNALSSHDQAFYENKMNADFSKVRIHNDEKANTSAEALNSKAYTVGNNIVFGRGKYSPSSYEGKKLLSHELAHVVQQSHNKPSIQRDMSAYSVAKTESIPTMDFSGGSSQLLEFSAEADGIRAALAQLIADGKIKEVKSSSGNKIWFAANHHKNADLSDIEKAFKDAGYSEATKMAKALYDIHSEYLYSNQKLITITAFKNFTHNSKNKLAKQNTRPLTEYEIRQAKRVFKSALDYSKITIEENSNIVALGGYARTIGNTIYFPDDSARSMAFMMHELSHVWQYQTTGWTYAPKALWAQVVEGYSYAPDGKTAEDALKEARAAGKTLYDYNKEQQGDIIADYFRRLQSSQDTSSFDPFISDIK